MTPFTALYRKECREHGWSLLTVFLMLYIILISLYFLPRVPPEVQHLSSILIWVCYINVTAAMSYAKEDEEKTAMFLRLLPVSGNTLLCAKLAWLGTAAACLTVPFLGIMLCPNSTDVLPNILYPLVLPLLFLLPWSLFWTTRIPNKLLACSAAIGCGCGFPALTSIFFGLITFTLICAGVTVSEPKWVLYANYTVNAGILLWVSAVALHRAARYYQLPEQTSNNLFLVNRNTAVADWLVRCFPQGRWSPFTAMLWQSITQSKDTLIFGIISGILFCGWEILLGRFFLASFTSGTHHSYFVNVIVSGSFAMFLFWIVSALVFVSVIFSRDQEEQRYRLFVQRGISPRLVWLSRIVPFAAVYLFPLPFYVHHCSGLRQVSTSENPFFLLAWSVLVYLLPFAIGSCFSILCKPILMSAALTSGTFFIILCTVFGSAAYGYHVGLGGTFMLGCIILLGFLLASRLIVSGWLANKTSWRRILLRG